MYITDATHMLDQKGAIAPKAGPALRMAEATGSLIQAATLANGGAGGAQCLACGASAQCQIKPSDDIVWTCSSCGEGGRIYNWRGTLWDLRQCGSTN